MEFGFVIALWASILGLELLAVVARVFLHPGPLRLMTALAMPALFIIGAVINALYNRIITGRWLEPSRRKARR